jgi:hypothetical protein
MTRSYCVAPRTLRLFFGLVALASVTLLRGDPPATSIHVPKATLDLSTHQVTVQLLNTTTDKTAVAYDIETKGFDARGKEVLGVAIGWEFLTSDPTSNSTSHYIPPGHTLIVTAPAAQDAVSVLVSVVGVVYLDRTWEGPYSVLIFDGRSRAAKVVRQALALLKSYPTTLAASRETMQALLAIESPIVTSVVANELHLTAPPDVQHPVADASLPANDKQCSMKMKVTGRSNERSTEMIVLCLFAPLWSQ